MDDMRHGVCAVCSHTEIVRSKPTGVVGMSVLVPIFAHHDNRATAFWNTKGAGVAELTVAVCRRCGFVQWFVDDPGAIPGDAVPRTEPDGPYR